MTPQSGTPGLPGLGDTINTLYYCNINCLVGGKFVQRKPVIRHFYMQPVEGTITTSIPAAGAATDAEAYKIAREGCLTTTVRSVYRILTVISSPRLLVSFRSPIEIF